jgi:hypothetical protein
MEDEIVSVDVRHRLIDGPPCRGRRDHVGKRSSRHHRIDEGTGARETKRAENGMGHGVLEVAAGSGSRIALALRASRCSPEVKEWEPKR